MRIAGSTPALGTVFPEGFRSPDSPQTMPQRETKMSKRDFVCGFEFSSEDTKKIRYSDSCMKLLLVLQEEGVAVLSKEAYDTLNPIHPYEDEYWSVYTNHGMIAVVVHEHKEVSIL